MPRPWRHRRERPGPAGPGQARLRARLRPQPEQPARHRVRDGEGPERRQQPHVQRQAVHPAIHGQRVLVLPLVERHQPVVLAHHVPVGPQAGERQEQVERQPAAQQHRDAEDQRARGEPAQAAEQQPVPRYTLPTVQVGPRKRGEDVRPVQGEHPDPPQHQAAQAQAQVEAQQHEARGQPSHGREQIMPAIDEPARAQGGGGGGDGAHSGLLRRMGCEPVKDAMGRVDPLGEACAYTVKEQPGKRPLGKL
jgi:hypothetical protein